MILYHYYRSDQQPFFSLSGLDDAIAIQTMIEIFRHRGDTVLDGRFREPEKYLRYRRRTEQWLWDEFTQRNGNPTDRYPCYFTAGRSTWLIDQLEGDYHEVALDVSALSSSEVSFTYPDSMTSWGYGMLKPEGVYDPGLHGRVFVLEEAEKLPGTARQPGEPTAHYLGNSVPQYLEAQVWNATMLRQLMNEKSASISVRTVGRAT